MPLEPAPDTDMSKFAGPKVGVGPRPPEHELDRLRAGLQRLGLWPSLEARQQALAFEVFSYLESLQRWNRRHNLTAVRDPAQMLVQHIFDCAAVVPVLRSWIESRDIDAPNPRILDVGSGAGLPGIVLAWFWPDARIVLVEPAAKRVAFLQQAIARPALANVQVLRARIEDVTADDSPPDAIICRAFSSLAEYARAVDHLASPLTVVVAMKARLDSMEKQTLTMATFPGPPRENREAVQDGASRLARQGAWALAAEVPLQVPGLDASRTLVRLRRVPADPSDNALPADAALSADTALPSMTTLPAAPDISVPTARPDRMDR